MAADTSAEGPLRGARANTGDDAGATVSQHPHAQPGSTPPALAAALHRFLVSEVRSVRFGPAEDASATLVSVLCACALTAGALWAASAAARRPLWRLFLLSNQVVAAMLLFAWIAAYSAISLVIWWQFERGERYPADDYYLVAGEDGAAECAPVVLQLPDAQVALAVGARSAIP